MQIGAKDNNPLQAIEDALAKIESPTKAVSGALASLASGALLVNAPLTILSSKLQTLGEKLGKAADGLTVPTGVAVGSLERIGKGLALLQAPATSLGNQMRSLASTAMLPLAAATNVYAAASGAVIQQMLHFVEKSSPATAFQFNRALDDLAGTMGQILTPVIQGVTVFVRATADALQGLKPALAPIMNGISQVIQALAPLMQALMQAMGPAFQAVGFIIADVVVPAIKTLADTLTDFAKTAMRAIQELSGGMIAFDDFQAKSSFGAAIRPAAYSKIEDIGKRTTLSALNQTDRGNEVPRKIDKSNELLAKILEKIGVGKDTARTAANISGRVQKGIMTAGLSEIGRLVRDL